MDECQNPRCAHEFAAHGRDDRGGYCLLCIDQQPMIYRCTKYEAADD